MNVINRRVATCRLICKMQNDPEEGNKLGLMNKSYVKEKKHNSERKGDQ